MQVKALIDYFQLLATLHTGIASFGTGDRWEVAIDGETNYPELWLEQVFNYNEEEPVAVWNVGFIIHAIQLHDESDEVELLDLCHTIGRQIIEKIKIDKLYLLGDNINAISFTEAFEDFNCGWRFEIQLTERLLGKCDVENLFSSSCNYTATIDNTESTVFSDISAEGDNLYLPTLPINLNDEAGAGAAATALQADLVALGYTATVDATVVDGLVTYTVSITASTDNFLVLVGQRANKVFSVECPEIICCLELTFQGAFLNEFINSIQAGGGNLSLTNVPLNTALSNANYATEVAALEAELAGLGYPITFTDTTPGGASFRTIFLQMCVLPSDLESIQTKTVLPFVQNCS